MKKDIKNIKRVLTKNRFVVFAYRYESALDSDSYQDIDIGL